MVIKRKAGEHGLALGPKRHRFPTQTEIESGSAHYHKAGGQYIYDRKYYSRGHVYIVDDKNVDDLDTNDRSNPWSSPFVSPHVAKCSAMAQCFRAVSPYKVHGVQPMSHEKYWDGFWDEEITKWHSDDLILVYYHGNAGGNGGKYTWFPSHESAAPINAYDFIEKLISSGKDILMIIEAYLPTRFQAKLELRKLSTDCDNAVGIFATGHPGQDNDDNCLPNDFTESLLTEFHHLINGENDIKHCSTKGWSIAELLREDKHINNNPTRLNIQPKPKHRSSDAPEDSKVYRILLDKHHIRWEKRLIFCRDTIEDTAKERELADHRARDEGLDELTTDGESGKA